MGTYRPSAGELSGIEGDQVYLAWGIRSGAATGVAFWNIPVVDAAVVGETYTVTFLHGGLAGEYVPSNESRVGFVAGDVTDSSARQTVDKFDPADGVMTERTHSWTATEETEGLPVYVQFIANSFASVPAYPPCTISFRGIAYSTTHRLPSACDRIRAFDFQRIEWPLFVLQNQSQYVLIGFTSQRHSPIWKPFAISLKGRNSSSRWSSHNTPYKGWLSTSGKRPRAFSQEFSGNTGEENAI